MVAGASGSLAGLLFVALSLHVRQITTFKLYRYRARLSLSAMMSVLVMASLLVIPRQSARALAAQESIPLATMIVLLVLGFLELRRVTGASRRPYILRTAAGLVLAVVGCIGNALLATGRSLGLEILALCFLLFLVWMVFTAWALVVGLADEASRHEPS